VKNIPPFWYHSFAKDEDQIWQRKKFSSLQRMWLAVSHARFSKLNPSLGGKVSRYPQRMPLFKIQYLFYVIVKKRPKVYLGTSSTPSHCD